MTETACFIHGRAISLGYEARRFPKVAPQAYAWLRLAQARQIKE